MRYRAYTPEDARHGTAREMHEGLPRQSSSNQLSMVKKPHVHY
jgi:hypothetical protein